MNMHMHRSWKTGVAIVALVLIGGTAFGWAVTGLWNWLMPTLFGLGRITFWQALGLFVLGRILFGGFHGFHGGHREHRRRMHERWQQMTPEQRESFSRGLRRGCSWHDHRGNETPDAEKPAP
jgi:hypothetical protein